MNTTLAISSATLLAGLALALPFPTPTAAPPSSAAHQEVPSIVVEGVGRAPITGASTLHLRARVEATTEIAAETLADFLEARRRATEAFEGLGLEGLQVLGRGLGVEHHAPMEAGNEMGMVMMGMDAGGFEGVRYSEELDVLVPGFGALDDEARRELLGRALDVGLDAGVTFISSQSNPQLAILARIYGGSEEAAGAPMASLTHDDRGPEDAALAAALDEAHARARSIADHTGREVGDVRRVEVVSISSELAALTSGGQVHASVKVTYELR